jgi:hypothetical protein
MKVNRKKSGVVVSHKFLQQLEEQATADEEAQSS